MQRLSLNSRALPSPSCCALLCSALLLPPLLVPPSEARNPQFASTRRYTPREEMGFGAEAGARRGSGLSLFIYLLLIVLVSVSPIPYSVLWPFGDTTVLRLGSYGDSAKLGSQQLEFPALYDSSGRLCAKAIDGSDAVAKNATTTDRKYATVETTGFFWRDYFLEQDLVKGSKLVVDSYLRNPIPKREFLPPAEAKKVPPVTSGNLKALLYGFNVTGNSTMGRMMASTAVLCEGPVLPRQVEWGCPTSALDMKDFIARSLFWLSIFSLADGVPPKVLATRGVPESVPVVKEPLTIVEVQKGGIYSNLVTCHTIMFPSLAYYCRTSPWTKVVHATLQTSNGSVIHGLGVCYLGTSSWPSTHPAFSTLDVAPGSPVCHWMADNDLVGVPGICLVNRSLMAYFLVYLVSVQKYGKVRDLYQALKKKIRQQ